MCYDKEVIYGICLTFSHIPNYLEFWLKENEKTDAIIMTASIDLLELARMLHQ